MKDKKELKQLKSRLGALDEKLAELNAAELEEVIGGISNSESQYTYADLKKYKDGKLQFDTNNNPKNSISTNPTFE